MENTANSAIHFLGVRHHGPGSANRVVAALDVLRPRQVLIEGPSDCTELLPMLAQRDMTPPVALLAYVADDPACSLYYPFAEFSPEYQACCWAVRNSATVAFIDMPVSIQLAQMLAQRSEPDPEDVNPTETDAFLLDDALPLSTDPIGALATGVRHVTVYSRTSRNCANLPANCAGRVEFAVPEMGRRGEFSCS